MKRRVMILLSCLSIGASMGAVGCYDGENPPDETTHAASGGGGKAGGGRGSGGLGVAGGGTHAQSGSAGLAAASGSAGVPAGAGHGGLNAGGTTAAGMAGQAGHPAAAGSGGVPAAGGGNAGGGATSHAGQGVNAGQAGAATGGTTPVAGSSGAANAGAGTVGGAHPIAGQAGSGLVAPGGGEGGTNAAQGGIAGTAGSAGSAGAASCQLVPQSGCPGGQACDFDYSRLADGATACRSISSAGTETNLCTTSLDCAAGYACVGGSCMRFCHADVDCSGGGGRCVVDLLGPGSVPIPGVKACSQDCNPLSSAGCPSGWGCGVYLDTATQTSFTGCHQASTGTQGATCANDTNCAQGYGCVTYTSASTTATACLAYCQPSSPSCATASTTCNTLVGSSAYGVCVPN